MIISWNRDKYDRSQLTGGAPNDTDDDDDTATLSTLCDPWHQRVQEGLGYSREGLSKGNTARNNKKLNDSLALAGSIAVLCATTAHQKSLLPSSFTIVGNMLGALFSS